MGVRRRTRDKFCICSHGYLSPIIARQNVPTNTWQQSHKPWPTLGNQRHFWQTTARQRWTMYCWPRIWLLPTSVLAPQWRLPKHHQTAAKRPCSITKTSCQPLPNEPSAPQKRPLNTSSTSCMQLCYNCLTTAKHLVNVLYAAVLQLPVTQLTFHTLPSVILLPSCQSLVTHLRFTCPTIALLLRDN